MRMNRAFLAAVSVASILAMAAWAQDRPTAKTADDATPPVDKPASISVQADTVAAPTTKPDVPPADENGVRVGSVGRLIPPDEMDRREAERTAALEPPMPEQLREDDFAYSACLLELFTQGVGYEELPAMIDEDQRDCGIARPVRITSILPGVALAGGAEMRCDTARSLSHWVRDFVAPATKRLPGSPKLTEMTLGTTYQCRGVVGGASSAKLSEHALGNAIDIASFRFDDGSEIVVAPREDSGDMLQAFQATVQASACMDFATVLGPGSNAAHDNHLHLDVKARRGGYRLCQ
ncbi:MAG: extensin [Paracoccus denitrificans]|nr:MAG: extensin [Paracoccus denitrificans]PZO83986.1 MAG: extensin [Paracoccus denitrificans]